MLTIEVTAQTSAPPQRVLEAARDFSDRRGEVWSNVKPRYFEVHEAAEDFAEVTEGTWIAGLFWERCRYEWPNPDEVTGTVKDSNVFEPGSSWELRATPRDGGSEVEMILRRTFKPGPKGRIAMLVNHLAGERLFGSYLRSALRSVEKRT